jgi:hypothetical protein
MLAKHLAKKNWLRPCDFSKGGFRIWGNLADKPTPLICVALQNLRKAND